jgi:hypothetical protein
MSAVPRRRLGARRQDEDRVGLAIPASTNVCMGYAVGCTDHKMWGLRLGGRSCRLAQLAGAVNRVSLVPVRLMWNVSSRLTLSPVKVKTSVNTKGTGPASLSVI